MTQVIFVVGPTASGKSELALRLAEQDGGVIVNCDSIQQYAHLQIGAAKPTPRDLQRVPHYLYGTVKPPMAATVGDYHREFFKLMKELESKEVPSVYVVGGTGFYFRALEKGLFTIGKASEDIVRNLELEAEKPDGLSRLYAELQSVDPVAANKIHLHDQYRLVRALEIWRSTGRRPSEIAEEHRRETNPFPYPLTKIGVWWDRPQLHERIHRRVRWMLQNGFIEEVENLNKLNLQTWAPMQSVGYKEVQSYLRGEYKTLGELEEKILFSTRQLAKRQITWFKRDLEIQWQKSD